MPGVIESNEPPDGGGGITSFSLIEATGPIPPPTADDIEDFADRLRFMGLDEDHVVEFERQASEDYRGAQQWVQNLFAARPHPPQWLCDCGEALVPDDWHGQATVRCSECGHRWGLDVAEGVGGEQWSVSGPADEWLTAHPPDLADPYGDYPPEVVIANGLPTMVAGIAPGTAFPLATYQADRWAAVLYVFRYSLTEFDLPGDEYGYELEYLTFDSRDEWSNWGSSGGGWVNPFAPPRALLDKYVVLGTGHANPCADGECVSLTGGICSSAVATIEIDADGDRSRFSLNPTRPIFLVGTSAPAAVARFLDEGGTPLRDHRGATLEFDLGTADSTG